MPQERQDPEHVRVMVTELHQIAIRLEGSVVSIAEDVTRHAHILEGNGRDGLRVQVRLLEEKLDRILRDRDDQRAHVKLETERAKVFGLKWETIGAAVALAASLLAYIEVFVLGG